MSLINLQSFKVFLLLEGGNQGNERDKSDMYRRISYNVSEIFGLYGFFFNQQKDYFNPANWKTLMKQVTAPKKPKERWDKIISLINFLQEKVEGMRQPKAGDFGFIGTYSYPEETKVLVDAAGYLKTASDIILKTFSEEEVEAAMTDMEDILVGNPAKNIEGMKPLTTTAPASSVVENPAGGTNSNTSESLALWERRSRLTEVPISDILNLLDQIGTKVLNIKSSVNALQDAYPEADSKIQAFRAANIDLYLDKINKAFQEDIPVLEKGSSKQREGYLKKIQAFDKEVDGIWDKYEALKKTVMDKYQPISSSLEYIEDAETQINDVRQGIVDQANDNALDYQTSQTVSGTVDYSGRKSRDASQKDSEAQSQTRQENQDRYLDDVKKYLEKKYARR